MDGADHPAKRDGLPEKLDQEGGDTEKKGFWRRRSKLERRLLILIGLAALLILILIIVVIAIASISRQPEICYSEGCIKAASRIIKGMDQDVAPCENFFEYACGQWNRNHRIPDGDSRTTSFGRLRKKVKETLRGSLEEPALPTDPRAVAMAKDLYKECINRTQTEARGVAPLLAHLAEYGGWPVLETNWREEDFDFVAQMITNRRLGADTFFWTWVNVDEKKSDRNINTIGESGLGMPSREYFLKGRDDPTLKSYEEFAVNLAVMLGAPESKAKREIGDMVDMEIELAKIKTRPEDERDLETMYNKMTMKEFKAKYPEFDFGRYMTEIFALVNITSNDTDPIMVRKPEFLTKLFRLINNTPKRTVANYIVWRELKSYKADLPEQYRKTMNNYKKTITGTADERPRWQVCVGWVEKKLGGAVGRIFVQKTFDEKSKDMAEEMITNIRAAFDEFLVESDWMDEITKAAAKDKAEGLRPRVAYPDFIMNDTALDEKYNDIDVIPNKFFETVVGIAKAIAKRNLRKIQKPIDKLKWSIVYPATVNAFYFPSTNQIMFPAGILQPPYFHQDYPKYLNYGGVGMMMGHEITHGFDDEGRQSDKDGNLVPWWQPSAVKNFKKKAKCIIDQYSNYLVPEINMTLNGVNSQGENIADNGGLKESFRAYQNYIAAHGEEPRLPGLKLTPNQLFFVNFAQIRCSNSRPQSYLMAVRSWRHSPNRYRVVGTVSNMPEFAAAYNCPVGSPMNPEKKCRVW